MKQREFLSPLLGNHSPDFEMLVKILTGERELDRIHFAEILVDYEVIEYIVEQIFGEKLFLLETQKIKEEKISKFMAGEEVTLLTTEEEKIFIKNYIDFYYRMGYDYVPDVSPVYYHRSMILPKVRLANDTATYSKKGGKREWVEEGRGIITCWEDFEKFHWERMRLDLEEYYRFFGENLPQGMKIIVAHSLYEMVLECILGYEGLFYLLYDEPDLVKAVFDKMGKIIYDFYKSLVTLDSVGAIFHADDLGYKTGTMLSPEILRNLVFPWFKKYACLAHENGKMFWYHCCGNVLDVMEDLIEVVKIDAFHSFQDVIIPVAEFKRRYGNKIATLGGVDMDKLSRLNEEDLRKYVKTILDECTPDGKYALGSGNSIANYIPVRNYLIMLEEGAKWNVL